MSAPAKNTRQVAGSDQGSAPARVRGEGELREPAHRCARCGAVLPSAESFNRHIRAEHITEGQFNNDGQWHWHDRRPDGD